MSSARTGVDECTAEVLVDAARAPGVPDGLFAVLSGDGPGTCAVPAGDPLRGWAFAAQVDSNEVHVNDGYTRHGGEGQLAAFTRRQWIGIQTTAVSYPTRA